MLRVSLLGNLGADPELRYSQKGTAIATFRVAANQVRTSPDGERQESTEWFRVKASGWLAESAQRLTKGTRVLVVGRLEITHFQSREGEPRVGFEVWADEVVNVSARPGPDSEPDSGVGEEESPNERPVRAVAPLASSNRRDARGSGEHGPRRAVPAQSPSAPSNGRETVAPGPSRGGPRDVVDDLDDIPF
jgi:single-strand DNA-binding protein